MMCQRQICDLVERACKTMALKKALYDGPESCAVVSGVNTSVLRAEKTTGANAVGCKFIVLEANITQINRRPSAGTS